MLVRGCAGLEQALHAGHVAVLVRVRARAGARARVRARVRVRVRVRVWDRVWARGKLACEASMSGVTPSARAVLAETPGRYGGDMGVIEGR